MGMRACESWACGIVQQGGRLKRFFKIIMVMFPGAGTISQSKQFESNSNFSKINLLDTTIHNYVGKCFDATGTYQESQHIDPPKNSTWINYWNVGLMHMSSDHANQSIWFWMSYTSNGTSRISGHSACSLRHVSWQSATWSLSRHSRNLHQVLAFPTDGSVWKEREENISIADQYVQLKTQRLCQTISWSHSKVGPF